MRLEQEGCQLGPSGFLGSLEWRVGLNVQAERKRLNCVLRVWKMRRVGLRARQVNLAVETQQYVFYGEFDSGSERTLAACLRHASRTGEVSSNTIFFSGARVSNT